MKPPLSSFPGMVKQKDQRTRSKRGAVMSVKDEEKYGAAEISGNNGPVSIL
jgi:hypothetical protein